eukprot:4368761-Alexandrium_andersonii.AAC.1
MNSAQVLAQIPNLPTKAWIEGSGAANVASVASSNPQCAREPLQGQAAERSRKALSTCRKAP